MAENSVRTAYEELLSELTDLETRAAGGTIAVQTSRSLTIGGALGALGNIGAASRNTSPSNEADGGPAYPLPSPSDAPITPPAIKGVNTLLLSLCSQLLYFVRGRINCVKFYECCYRSHSSHYPLDYSDLAATVSDTVATCSDYLTQPLLNSLQANLRHECDVLHALLQCLCCTQHHNFLSALLHLDVAHEHLRTWQRKEGKKSSFSSSFLKGPSVPPLFDWLFNLKSAVTAKFSLYFYNSLAHEATPAEMKALLSRQSVDYVGKMVSYHRKLDATNVCLVLETSGVLDYRGPGYHNHYCCALPPSSPSPAPHNLQTLSAPSNPPPPSPTSSRLSRQPSVSTIPPPPPPPPPHYSHRTFERIFCCPLQLSQTEATQSDISWTSLLHYLPKRSDQLPAPKEGVVQVYHHQSGYTHYLKPVEPLVTAVVSYDCHRTDKESAPVREFLNDLSHHLNMVYLFAALKPK